MLTYRFKITADDGKWMVIHQWCVAGKQDDHTCSDIFEVTDIPKETALEELLLKLETTDFGQGYSVKYDQMCNTNNP